MYSGNHPVAQPPSGPRHYPALTNVSNPQQALADQQAQRANSQATRQQIIRLFLGGQTPTTAPARPILGAF